MRIPALKSAVLGSLLAVAGCATFEKWIRLGEDSTDAGEAAAVADATKAGRAPAAVPSNPLRIQEYCVVDNFSRMGSCYPSLDLCERAAQGFGMCSGR